MATKNADPSSERIQALVRVALENSHLTPIEIQRLLDRDGDFLDGLRGLIGRFKADVSDYDHAYEILGDDFISPLETADPHQVIGGRSLTYTREQLETFAATLPRRETLEWCKAHEFIVVAGPPRPLSFLNILTLKRGHFHPASYRDHYCDDVPGKILPQWLILRKQPVLLLNPHNEPVDATIRRLPKEERPANAAELVWGMIAYREKTSRFLIPLGKLVATASPLDSGRLTVRLSLPGLVGYKEPVICVGRVFDDKDIAIWNPGTLERVLASVKRSLG